MLFKLILKDLKAHKHQIFTRTLIPMLILSGHFTFQFYHWDVYFMIACMTTAAASSFFSFIDKKQNIIQLTASLPVTRQKLVLARYLISLMIITLGLALFYGNAWLGQFIYSEPKTQFASINHLKVLWMAVLFLVIQVSLYLPVVFRGGFWGSIIVFILTIVISIAVIAIIFRPGSFQFPPEFQTNNPLIMSFWVGVLILLLLFSFGISTALFCKKDL